jgi:hypothetical protein
LIRIVGVGSYVGLQFLRYRRTIAFYIGLVLLAAVGVSLLLVEAATHLPPAVISFLEEVGKALIIASILAGSVDIYLKRRLATEFAKDVSPFIEGLGLPREFQDEIAFIKRIPIYRRNFQLTYRIYRDPELRQGMVRVRTTFAYEIVNPTDTPQTFDVGLAVEDSHPDVGPASIVSVGIRGESINATMRNADEIRKKMTVNAGFLEYKEQVLIPANSEGLLAWTEGESYLEESDSDIVYLTQATTHISVHVEAPDDLSVDVYIGHRFQEMSPPKVALIPPPPARTHTWQMSAGMLRGHAIFIEWSKTKTPRVAAAAAAGSGSEQPKT